MVIIGIIAFERACFITTIFSLSPFALAVVTYSSFRESIILERVIRLRIEDSAVPKVIDGRIIWLILPLPATGSQPSIIENKIIKSGPSQKLGIEMPRSDRNIEPLIISLPLGIIAAYRQYSIFDNGSMFLSLLAISIPNFWLGPLLIILFSVMLGWLPVAGRGGISHIILPSITLGTALSSILS